MSKDQNLNGTETGCAGDAALPAECVEGVTCNPINEKPDSNYFVAFLNEANEWEPVHLRCDEGCEPGDARLFVSGAKMGDCAYFACSRDDSGRGPLEPKAP